MTEILNKYDSITLDEMRGIKLMNRIDTKFVTTVPKLKQLLELAKDDYYVQESDSLRIAPYYTLYFDTADCAMYNRHETGQLDRQKIRIRSYVSAGLSFLEVKTKNNHGRTKKKRVAMENFDAMNPDHEIRFQRQDKTFEGYDNFLRTHLRYAISAVPSHPWSYAFSLSSQGVLDIPKRSHNPLADRHQSP